MTLCIAALCKDYTDGPLLGRSSVVLCFDKRVETLTAGADIEFKYELLSPRWGALIAGDIGLARELTTSYRSLFEGKPEFESNELLMALRAPLNSLREDYADRFVRRKLSMTLGELKQHGNARLPKDVYRQTWYEISAQDLGVQLILFGWHQGDFRLFKISFGELYRSEPFAVIGSGSDIAEPALYQREYRDSWGTGRAVYCAYEAQRLGSIAPGVSKNPKSISTVIMYYDDELPTLGAKVVREGDPWLEERFQEFGPRTLDELTIPNTAILDMGAIAKRVKARPQGA